MKHKLMSILRKAFLRLLPRTVSGALLALAATLFLLDHRWTELTCGALALAAGAVLIKN